MAGGTLLKNTGFAALAAALALASTAGVASAQEVREVPGDLAVGTAAAAPAPLPGFAAGVAPGVCVALPAAIALPVAA